MKILRTILSQSRKYRLYLWMVTQTLSEVPPELMSSIEGNVGAALAFRSSPDDAKRLAKLLHSQRPEAVERLIPALEDYAAIARKRPVGGRPVDPPFRIIFPRLSDPIHDFTAALDYMKVEMEKIYGGAVGDRSLVYKEDIEEEMREVEEASVRSLVLKLLSVLDELGLAIQNSKPVGGGELLEGSRWSTRASTQHWSPKDFAG